MLDSLGEEFIWQMIIAFNKLILKQKNHNLLIIQLEKKEGNGGAIEINSKLRNINVKFNNNSFENNKAYGSDS